MVSLTTVGRRFESLMVTVDGVPFYGTIEPNVEGRQSTYDFSEARLILRVDNDAPVHSRDVIVDTVGRRFLLADHDTLYTAGQVEYRTHRLYPANKLFKWEREQSQLDPLTGLPKGEGLQLVGQYWGLIERLEREFTDPGLRIREDRHRLVTGQEVQIGDVIDGKVVRRVDPAVGIFLAELQ